MKSFLVWAPEVNQVDLVLPSGERRPLEKSDQIHIRIDENLEAGSRYKFSLDGAEPLPDPRSASQPDGVHGFSEVVDHGEFAWSDQVWRGFHLATAVIYEAHIGTFTEAGTFDSAIAKLDHLVSLGIDAVELLPPIEFPGSRGWGYDGVFLFAPHHSYGGPNGMKRFVDACHHRGLAVVVDCVYNHLGPDGNYLGVYGPYFTDKYQTPWGQAVNFDDRGSDGVREFVIDNAMMWFRDYHVDALRLDAVHAIYDFSAVHILREMQEATDVMTSALRRPLYLIAESDLNDPRIVEPPEIGGHGLSAQWSDDFHHALHTVLTGETNGYYADFGSLRTLVEAFNSTYVDAGELSGFRGRRHGRSADHLSTTKFLAYLQNHDQVGNRAMGERSAVLMSSERLRIGAALVLLSPFVPMLFQGEEWGAETPFQYFTEHLEKDLGDAVSEGRRREFVSFGWAPESVPDPQALETFERSKLRWSDLESDKHTEFFDWCRRLIAVRRENPLMAPGRDDFDCFVNGDVLVVLRGNLSILANLGTAPAVEEVLTGSEVLMAWPPTVTVKGGLINLPPDGVAVIGAG